ncbi:ABC transporter substrate-binding protein [Paenibacillus arenosi]|uniref:ABC transporter substrate-binding protein n=1 Tax=Paenibacillus arenosi TaxID=2774142 RepID=A0ABR9B0X2_9BACL|nr:ABC transporter substrate-binding protein [Paenibacillus arenosi]MBD8500042.1 ABC transporter substrate-binding protein [Paenibacillus arenosi]
MKLGNWKRILSVLTIVALSLTVMACGGANTAKPAETKGQVETPAPESKPADQELKTTYPLKIKDATGQEFTFEKAPERIVSVSPADTEMLFAIGLDKEIVGVSDHDDYPAAAATKPKMGGLEPNVEAIIAAKPDVVFTGIAMKDEAVNKFRDMGIRTFKLDPKSYDGVIYSVETYGLITDRQADAKKVTDHMKQVRADVQASVKDAPKKNVYMEFSPGWTVGSGEYMHELLEIAGGVNIAADQTGWFQINEETIIKKNPDVILYGKGVKDYDTNKPLETIIRERKGWSEMNALKNNQVIGIEDDTISRPGPRLADALQSIAKAIHPDQVK